MKSKKSQLTLAILIIYGCGGGYAIVDQIFNQWLMYYYLPPSVSSLKPLLPPILIAVALGISRIIDAVADPWVGFLSDRFDSRWGRRIPFIAVGALPLILCTIAYFYPIKVSEKIMFIQLSVTGSLFFIFYTLVGAPYNALIPEISHSRIDRINLSTWQSIFRLLFIAIATILPGIIINYLGQGDDERGIRIMVITLGLLALGCILIPVFWLKEKKLSGGKTSRHDFSHTIQLILSNKPFKIYLLGLFFLFIGFNTLRTSINYYVEEIMGYGKIEITIVAALLFSISLLFFYPINRLSRRFGYKKLMLISILLLIIDAFCIYGLGQFFPIEIGFIFFAFMGIPLSGAAFFFPPAMLSEISTVATEKTGVNSEGLYFGIQGFFLKAAFFMVAVAFPFLLVLGNSQTWQGFFEQIFQRPDHITRSGIYMTTLFSIINLILAFIFYLKYPEQISRDQ